MVKKQASHSVLEQFFRDGTNLTYEKGEIIIRPEDTPQGVFFIKEGFIKSYDITKYGEENLLVIRKTGQMFPVLWTMTDERTDVFYQSMSDVELYRIDRQTYLKKLRNDVEFIQAVLDQVLELYRIHSQRVLNLEYRSAAERVAYRLVTLADRFGEESKSIITINAPIRHQDIAASVNCSRETASRELSKLEKRGLIGSADGKLLVKDMDGLKSKIQQRSRLEKVLKFKKSK